MKCVLYFPIVMTIIYYEFQVISEVNYYQKRMEISLNIPTISYLNVWWARASKCRTKITCALASEKTRLKYKQTGVQYMVPLPKFWSGNLKLSLSFC